MKTRDRLGASFSCSFQCRNPCFLGLRISCQSRMSFRIFRPERIIQTFVQRTLTQLRRACPRVTISRIFLLVVTPIVLLRIATPTTFLRRATHFDLGLWQSVEIVQNKCMHKGFVTIQAVNEANDFHSGVPAHCFYNLQVPHSTCCFSPVETAGRFSPAKT